MRKSNREVKDLNEIIDIMKKCDVCRIALNDKDGYPYIIPLNFGLDVDGSNIRLIFHSASEGYKVDLMEMDNRATFEMDTNHMLQYFEDKGYCTFAYESVIGRGRLKVLDDNEKLGALKKVMAQYHGSEDTYFSPAALDRTLVYCLEVEQITGKRKEPK